MRRFPQRFYSPEGEGGGEAKAQEATAQATEQVAQAAEEMKVAAVNTTSDVSAAMFQSIHDVLTGIHTELKRTNDRVDQAAQSTADVAAQVTETPEDVAEEAEIEVEKPKDERHLRRGRRKVKRG